MLVTITQIDGNLRRQFLAALPDRAPSFFFIDIPSTQAAPFDDYLRKIAPGATVEDVPMLRGRIVGARAACAPRTSSRPPIRNGCCRATAA
nr:hypothetical protein [Bradyrhizobium amphicarpaeae]